MRARYRKTLQAALVSVALVLSVQACAQEKRDAPARPDRPSRDAALNKQDAQYLTDMARSDLAEVAAGKLASSKASSDEVRKYGQRMVDEHSKMLAEGGKLARSRGFEPPSAPAEKHQAELKKLEGLSGEQFDQAFMQQMVTDHREALRLVQEAASKASDADLKALASKAAAHVEKHLKEAQQLAKSSTDAKK